MFWEITYSAIAKHPGTFSDALKTAQNEKSCIFQEIDIPKIHVQQFENFQNIIGLKFDALPSQKTLSGWKMELTLDRVAQMVLGAKYAKNHKYKE